MFKTVMISTLVGMLVAGVAVGNWEEKRLNHALEMNKRGYVPAYDPDHNFHWAPLDFDKKIADAMSASAFEQMSENQPKRKKPAPR